MLNHVYDAVQKTGEIRRKQIINFHLTCCNGSKESVFGVEFWLWYYGWTDPLTHSHIFLHLLNQTVTMDTFFMLDAELGLHHLVST